MTGFVKIILEASFTAGLAALAVMLIRLAMKKAPKRWAYALWAVVFFRCLCPFSVESGLSVFNAVNAIPERTVETETVEALSEAAENSEIENILPVQTDLNTYGYQTAAPVDTVYAPPVAVRTENVPEKKPVNKYAVMFGVWAFGASAMALYGVISYVLLMRKLRTAVKTEEGVYESDIISTAFSAGFFPPKIYVPCGLFEEERKLIIAHERVHIKRLDYIIKPVAFLALTVHWFNPVIWLAFALMTKDMELSCDEAVLKIFGAGEKKAYSEALLRVSMKRSGLADSYNFLPLAFAETGIKGRVKNVLKYKKPTVIVTVLAAAVVAVACAVLGTNAKSASDDNGENVGYTLIDKGETAVLLAGSEEISFELGAPNEFDMLLKSGKNVTIPANQISTEIDGKKVLRIFDITYDQEVVDGSIRTVSMSAGHRDYEMWYVGMKQAKIDNIFFDTADGLNYLNIEMTVTPENEKEADKLKSVIELDSRNRQEIKCSCEESGGDIICKFSMNQYEYSGCERRYAVALSGFDDVPVYINSDLLKVKKVEYVSIPEGETEYILADGAKVCIAHAPDKNTSLDSTDERVYGIQYTSDTNGGDKSRSVWLGMRAKNNELNRQICLDFGNKKITGFSVEDIYATDLQFTAVIKVTLADGEEITVISPNEPNAEIRVVNGDKENEYLLYMTADYNRENVDEYAIDLNGFDDITPQINAACADILISEGEVVYDQIFKGTTNLSLNGYVPAYIACGLEERITGAAIGFDDSGNVLSTSDTYTYRVEFHNAYTDKMDAFYLDYFWNEETRQKDNVRILAMTTKFGANLIAESLFDMTKYDAKNITLEDMYTENKADALYLTVKLKFVSDSNTEEFLEEISNPVLDTPGTYTTVVEKGVNEGEYTVSFRIRYINNVYNLDSFAVVLCGFDEAEKYVNPKLLLDYPHTEESENAASRENVKIQKVYKNGTRQIKLYDGGRFDYWDFLSSYYAVPDPCKSYRYENKELILTFIDGSELYFDVVYDEKVQDDKLVYNKNLSRRTDARSRNVQHFDDGEVFLPDNDSLEYSKAAEREKAYQSSINCSDLEMIYSRDFRSIYLYKNGDFDFYDSSRENDPNEGIDGSYKIDGETLTLKYNDGGKLCFDMISSAKEETDPDLVKEFEMCKYKLVYNKKNSRIPKKSTESIPEIYHGEIFDYDGIFIVMKMEAGEVSEEFLNSRETITEQEWLEVYNDGKMSAPDDEWLEVYNDINQYTAEAEQKRREEEEARKRAEEALKSSYPALQYPVVGEISKGYSVGDNFHHGVDFAVPKGTEVYAAASGEVTEIGSGWNGGYGNSVTIRHVGTMETVYAHMDEVLVKEGDEVNAGDVIGYSGSTGDAVGDELHFEVRIEGQHVDPMEYLPPVLSYPTTGGIYRKYGEDGAKGIDFEAPTGTPVYASADGTVAEIGSGWNGGYGNSVTINHRGNTETIYEYMKVILVKKGDEVKKGDLIGYSGTTGDTAYQTLFFGVRINGSYVDPMDYLGLRHFDGDKYGNP